MSDAKPELISSFGWFLLWSLVALAMVANLIGHGLGWWAALGPLLLLAL